jgi:hypothetical protein
VAPPLLHWSQTVTVPAATASLSAGRTPPPFRVAWLPARPPSFYPCGVTSATPELAGYHTLPLCLPSLLSACHLLLAGRRHQSPTATAVAPQTRASPPSVGARANRPHRAPSQRNRPTPHLCSESVHPSCSALHQRWPSLTPHPGQQHLHDNLHTRELLISLRSSPLVPSAAVERGFW